MAVTLSTAITNIRSLLDEPTAQFWTDTELTEWINEACNDMGRKGEPLQATMTVSAVVNQQAYTIAPTDGSQVYRIHRIEFVPTGSSVEIYPLEFRGFMEMDAVWGINQNWPAAYPTFFTIWNSPPALQIKVYPVPAQTGTFNVYYYRVPIPVVNTTDDLDCLTGWEDLVYDYAVYRALRKDADPRWQEAKKIYEDNLMAMIRNADTAYQDQPNYVTTGQTSAPAWLTGNVGGW